MFYGPDSCPLRRIGDPELLLASWPVSLNPEPTSDLRQSVLYSVWAFAAALAVLTVSGCGGGRVAPSSAADAQLAYDLGVKAAEGGSFSDAIPQLTKALETPGLPPDLVVDALLKRARCRAEGGDFQAAFADVHQAEQGATELDKVHLTRGIIFQKQGDQKAARAEFQKARQINPQLRTPLAANS
jgi:tetratricopeptide (TPR) repeat protein